MQGLNEYLIPYTISQVAGLTILIVAWKKTRWARELFALLFFWAACTNMYIGLAKPDTYLLYADNRPAFYCNCYVAERFMGETSLHREHYFSIEHCAFDGGCRFSVFNYSISRRLAYLQK